MLLSTIAVLVIILLLLIYKVKKRNKEHLRKSKKLNKNEQGNIDKFKIQQVDILTENQYDNDTIQKLHELEKLCFQRFRCSCLQILRKPKDKRTAAEQEMLSKFYEVMRSSSPSSSSSSSPIRSR